MIPLFPGRDATAPVPVSPAPSRRPPVHTWDTTWDDLDADDRITPTDADGGFDPADVGGAAREAARERVMRRLRTRQLSTAEARVLLRAPDADGRRIDDADVDALLRAMTRRGHLDDVRLAEQLVHAGAERKGQGRHAVARTLATRGIPRDVADHALRVLGDDDDERASAFARTKVRAMRRLDRDTAVRRLMGQLSRRGYPASVALTAARRAWDEQADDDGALDGRGGA